MFQHIRKLVFLPTFLGFISFLILGFFYQDFLVKTLEYLQSLILTYFGWSFSVVVFLCFVSCLILYISPVRNIRIGGKNSQPLFSKWQWVSISLCTTVAVGLIFWGVSEPLYHFKDPPFVFSGSQEERNFMALALTFLHWSFLPYSLYAVPSVLMAYVIYNRSQSLSLSSGLIPLLGKNKAKSYSSVIDSVSLFTLVTGFSSSLALGVLMISSYFSKIFSVTNTPVLQAVICLLIVSTFVLSAVSGLTKGIRILSSINIKLFCLLALLLLFSVPIVDLVKNLIFSFIKMLEYIPKIGFMSGFDSSNMWTKKWTTFYWSVWAAWAPMSAVFLAKIAKGRSVKELIEVYFFYPSFLVCFWVAILGSSSLSVDQGNGFYLQKVLATVGPEGIAYRLFDFLPLSHLSQLLVFFTIFLSFVTAADSTTEIMSSVCLKEKSSENLKTQVLLKCFWGGSCGFVAWFMVFSSGVDGMRILSNLGGFPAVFILVMIVLSLFKLVWTLQKKSGKNF